MDIYKKILADLAVEQLSFDENQVCCFEVHSAAGPEGPPYVVNIVGNTVLQELAFSVTTTVTIPSQIPKQLFLVVCGVRYGTSSRRTRYRCFFRY